MKVFVYFNLHKKTFSIRAMEGDHKGRVIAHQDQIVLRDATFKVSDTGRNRVLQEKRKNVHAGIIGHYHGEQWTSYDDIPFSRVTYNPYKHKSFVFSYDEHPIHNAEIVKLYVGLNQKPVILV